MCYILRFPKKNINWFFLRFFTILIWSLCYFEWRYYRHLWYFWEWFSNFPLLEKSIKFGFFFGFESEKKLSRFFGKKIVAQRRFFKLIAINLVKNCSFSFLCSFLRFFFFLLSFSFLPELRGGGRSPSFLVLPAGDVPGIYTLS